MKKNLFFTLIGTLLIVSFLMTSCGEKKYTMTEIQATRTADAQEMNATVAAMSITATPNAPATQIAELQQEIDEMKQATPAPTNTAPAQEAEEEVAATATPAPTSTTAPAAESPATTWPTTAQEAASLFGGEADWWEVSAEGGWHLIERHERVQVDPHGFAMEAYYDQAPGKDPFQLVTVTGVLVQGGTIWPDSGANVFCAMLAQKYPGLEFQTVAGKVDAHGFTKPDSCDQ